ncbi:PAS domain S-box protein [Pedobacter lithocola]|uniref:histidine kinase n=1 Tax=Pedobacter lithocola TaxID=1908239 RepID=A0ABV8PAW8_9SPHI
MPSIVVGVSPTYFKFVAANRAWLSFFGLSEQNLKDLTIAELNTIYNNHLVGVENFFINLKENLYSEAETPILNATTVENHNLTSHLIDVDEDGNKYFLHKIGFSDVPVAIVNNRFGNTKVLDALVMEGLDMIAVIDAGGNYLYVSPTSEGILGLTPEDFKNTNAFDFIHPDDVPLIAAQFSKAPHIEKILLKPYRFKTANGNWLWLETIISNKLNDPDICGFVANSRDITERVLDKIKAEISNERYRYAAMATSDAIWDWDVVNGTLIWAENFRLLFGYTEQELNTDMNSWTDKIHPHDVDRVVNAINSAVNSSETAWTSEYRFLKANGQYAIVNDNGFIIRDAFGKAVRMVGAMHDVTKKRIEEQRLQLLESVVLNTTDSVVITQIETGELPVSKIIYVNSAFTLMTGYLPEDVIGKSAKILEGPKTDQHELERVMYNLNHGYSCETNLVNYKKNGEEFWNNFSITPVANEKGIFDRCISIQRDVTKIKTDEIRKKLFNDIAASFNNPGRLGDILAVVLATINECTDFGISEIWIPDTYKRNLKLFAKKTNLDSGFQFHQQTIDIKKIPKGESLEGSVWEMMDMQILDSLEHTADLSRSFAALKAGLNTAIGLPLLHNGAFIGVLVLLGDTKLQSSSQAIVGEELGKFLGAEIRRKQLENELDQIFNFAPDIIAVLNYKGFFRKINLAACELLGYSDNELLSEPATHFIHPDDQEGSIEAMKKAIDNELSHFENRYITKDGKTIWLSWTASSVVEEGSIFVVGKDITERKNLEVLLYKSNSLALIGSWEIDPRAGNVYCSKVACEIIEAPDGFKPDAKMISRFFGAANDKAKNGSSDAVCLESLENWDEEIQVETLNGKLKWIRTIGQTELVNNKCVRAYGSIQDINVRKIAEIDFAKANKALAESQKRYQELFHVSPLPMWVYDFETLKFLDVNRAAVENYGFTRSEFLKMSIRDIRPHTELAILEKRLMDKTKHKNVFRGTFQHLTKDSRLINVDIKTNPIVFNGRKAKLVVANDITERLHYINTVEAQNEKLKEIAWIQSHIVRAPLARILALTDMLSSSVNQKKLSENDIVKHIESSAKELDNIIRDITIKSDASKI